MAKILIGNIKGPQGEQGPQGIQGPVGPQGPKGDTGPMPTLINNGTTTQAGVGALDAAYGKTLTDKDTNLQNQLNVLNGKTKSITGLFGSELNVGTVVQYPEGFTRQNAVCIAQHWADGTNLRDQFYGPSIAMTVMLRTDGVEVTPRTSAVFAHNFKIVLMRIS